MVPEISLERFGTVPDISKTLKLFRTVPDLKLIDARTVRNGSGDLYIIVYVNLYNSIF